MPVVNPQEVESQLDSILATVTQMHEDYQPAVEHTNMLWRKISEFRNKKGRAEEYQELRRKHCEAQEFSRDQARKYDAARKPLQQQARWLRLILKGDSLYKI